MILNCNSCGKKFVVPDNAITSSGRLVQCGSCGNKWKQFPAKEIKQSQSVPIKQKTLSKTRKILPINQETKKNKRKTIRKPREINLYSPEYLAKKHGIKLNDSVKISAPKNKVTFFWFL